MRPIIAKIKPANGFSAIIHIIFNLILPLAVFVLVRMHFVQLALIIILLSKWRMLAVRPRFWPANIRANAVDIMVNISLLLFMIDSNSQMLQLLWVALYGFWLLVIKPGSSVFMVSIQAVIGLISGLMALSTSWSTAPLYGLVLATGIVCFIAAHHFFDSFEEPYTRLLSYLWGYFGASLVWVLGHWLLFYGSISQPVLLLITLSLGLSALYYLDHYDKLSTAVRRQIVFILLITVAVVVSLSNWGHKTV